MKGKAFRTRQKKRKTLLYELQQLYHQIARGHSEGY